MEFPANLRYTKDHEWVEITASTARMGITHYAQDAMGDIVYVELPQVGDAFEAGEPFATVESVKAVSEIYSAVTGSVTAVNSALEDEPEKLNEAPYDAWLAEFTFTALDGLMDAPAYAAYVKGL